METILIFGDSISICLPSGYFDGSLLRQVPDNQYLFLSKTTLDCFIIELLEGSPDDICGLVRDLDVEVDSKTGYSEEIEFCRKDQLFFGLIKAQKYNLDILITMKSEEGREEDYEDLKNLTKSLKILNSDLFITK